MNEVEGNYDVRFRGGQYLEEGKATSGREIVDDDKALGSMLQGLPEEKQKKIISIINSKSNNGPNKISIHEKDAIDSDLKYHMERYDKVREEKLLESGNIVEEYNAYVNFQIDKMMELAKKGDGTEEIFNNTIYNFYGFMKKLGVPEGNIRNYITNQFFDVSDNPDVIKAGIRLRMNYNKRMFQIMEKMLRINYSMLGLTDAEIDAKISDIHGDGGIMKTNLVDLIEQDRSTYVKGKGLTDLRPLGGGVFIRTVEDMGGDLEAMDYRHFLQQMLRYDAVILAHGGDEDSIASAMPDITGKMIDLSKKLNKVNDDANKYIKKNTHYTSSGALINSISKDVCGIQVETMLREFNYIIEDLVEDSDDETVNKILDSGITSSTLSSMINHWYEYEPGIDALPPEFTKPERLFDMMHHVKDVRDPTQLEKFYNKYLKYRIKIPSKGCNIGAWIDKVTKGIKYSEFVKLSPEFPKYFSDAEKIINKRIEMLIEDCRLYVDFRNKAIEGMKFLKDVAKASGDEKVVDLKKQGIDRIWTCQPVKTPGGREFTVVNDLLRQMIKEGFKSIYLVSCNPGHHEIAKDILDQKGVHIHYSKNTLMAESSGYPDWYNECMSILTESETDLQLTAEFTGIDYNDDSYLMECAYGSLDDPVQENVLKDAWEAAVKLVKKVIAGLIGLFKAMINFIKKVINKIREKLSGKPKDKSVPKTKANVITLEGANVRAKDVTNYKELETFVTDACVKISRKIQDFDRRQTDITKKILTKCEREAKDSALEATMVVQDFEDALYQVQESYQEENSALTEYANLITEALEHLVGTDDLQEITEAMVQLNDAATMLNKEFDVVGDRLMMSNGDKVYPNTDTDPITKTLHAILHDVREVDGSDRRDLVVGSGVLDKLYQWLKDAILCVRTCQEPVPLSSIMTGVSAIGWIGTDPELSQKEKLNIVQKSDEMLTLLDDEITKAFVWYQKFVLVKLRDRMQHVKDKVIRSMSGMNGLI